MDSNNKPESSSICAGKRLLFFILVSALALVLTFSLSFDALRVDSDGLVVLGEEGVLKPETGNPTGAELYCTLPRTSVHTSIPTETKKKAFVYSPSGGYGNQFIEVLSALVVSRKHNRVLLVPPAAGHTTGFWNYAKVKPDFSVPMDVVLDFGYLEKVHNVELFSLNILPEQAVANYERRQGFNSSYKVDLLRSNSLTTSSQVPVNDFEQEMIKHKDARLVFARGHFYSKQWILSNKSLLRNLRYSPYIRQLAVGIVKRYFGRHERFGAMHVRLGDTRGARKSSESYAEYAKKMLPYPNKDTPIYILSDATKSDPFFTSLKETFHNLTFLEDLTTHHSVQRLYQDFKDRLEGNRIMRDLFGLVEELLAAQADWFIGTFPSTFSRTIAVFRENLGVVLPECNTNDPLYAQAHLPKWTGLISYGGKERAIIEHSGFFSNSTKVLSCSICGQLF